MEARLEEFKAWHDEKAKELGVKPNWLFATISGWDKVEYEALYRIYVESTADGADTDEKGRALENLARYFLEKGGFARNVREISSYQKWQVDGQGNLNKEVLLIRWGRDLCEAIGFQLYLECKNHTEAMTNEEFSLHAHRMEDHGCNVGVAASTSGYSIGRGAGIAETVHRNTWKNRYHLLLVFESLKLVAVDEVPPLDVLTDVLGYATNDEYENNKELQKRYSQACCHELMAGEQRRIQGI